MVPHKFFFFLGVFVSFIEKQTQALFGMLSQLTPKGSRRFGVRRCCEVDQICAGNLRHEK
jgi:hypothetical protein